MRKNMPSYQALLIRKAINGFAAALVTLVLVPIMSLPAAADIEVFGGNPLLDAIKANDPQRVEAAINGG